MKVYDIALRFFGFILPWLALSTLPHYLLGIDAPYTVMLYGGIVAILSLSIRDRLLELWESRQKT